MFDCYYHLVFSVVVWENLKYHGAAPDGFIYVGNVVIN